ncbi:low-density lipoprotein receptor-related protein 1-like isoform X2 [Choristoneura fumiferana]|uniref:low-density lipoprotein receptor-related protein 1-like isoform X2 n=1 Tax=Choristoneura fumiferana TaxID=7141 RepID=UPI003D15A5B9
MFRFKLVELGVLLALVVMIVFVLPGCLPISAEEPPSVLVVTLSSMHRMWPPRPIDFTDKRYSFGYGHGYVTTIDFNYQNRSFCYVQPTVLSRLSAFRCASADNFSQRWDLPNPTLFPSQFSITSIAYDWASGAWYFADKQQRCLYACDGSLQHCRMLHRDVEDPQGLAVDPTPPAKQGQAAGFVFWSQNNTSPSRLVRSDLAGNEVNGLLPKACSEACHPKALTLDIVNKLIFWVDGEEDTIEQSNYDGTGQTTVYKIEEAYNRNIRVFSWFNSTLYLPGYRGIFMTPLKGNETYTTVEGFPSTAVVYHGRRQPRVWHPCADYNGGCEHICVTAYNGGTPVARCLCQHGFQLDAAQHGVCTRIQLRTFMLVSRGNPPLVEVRAPPSIEMVAAPATGHKPTVADIDMETEYIYFFDLNQIMRQKLDGTGREVFIKDRLYECYGLAIDWMGRNLYWTDERQGLISVARLSAPAQHREIIRQVSYHPYSIILDPERRMMYWSVWAGVTELYGGIEAANMDGSGRIKLVSEDVIKPNGLVLDKAKEVLYWCDTQLNKIERLHLVNKKRATILTQRTTKAQTPLKQPYGLAFLNDDLLWSEQGSGLLRRMTVDGNISLVDSMTPPLYDIRVVTKSARVGRNACSDDNGGCAELCLATPEARTCACAAGRAPLARDNTRCGHVAS